MSNSAEKDLSNNINLLKQAAEHGDENAMYDLAICYENGEVTEKNRSEEHTSELQSQSNLVCRLLLEKKKWSDACPWRGAFRLRSACCCRSPRLALRSAPGALPAVCFASACGLPLACSAWALVLGVEV